MCGIGAIEAVISVGTTDHDLGRVEQSECGLDVMKCKEAQAGQLSHIEFLPGIGKEQAQNLRAS